eukprot:CAMPEP_0202712494 /NCGR_PEP_ID=MMETSP1385-20130828/41565_1 /ASSEMBLY_ACC=CAM_ASM_000861 /TAXON_ID=933848 /ORGANISM="Elphidium margaritaceum" /LENGTH=130 /DNA_ID=CAMNT_0049372553 /DNA_START=12 /DNA_END=404 /DNA_ORIENTATION=+
MSYLARGYGVVRFHPNRLNRGLKMDEFYFQNIKGIHVEYPKSHRNLRWFANFQMPVIRYWNPDLRLSVKHSKSLDMEPRIVLDFTDDDDGTRTQVLKAHNLPHDVLFEQVMQVEQGAIAEELQQSLAKTL